MSKRHRELILGGVLLSLVSLSVADMNGRDDEWPALLSAQPASVDPGYAALQLRANLSLARMVQSDQIVE